MEAIAENSTIVSEIEQLEPKEIAADPVEVDTRVNFQTGPLFRFPDTFKPGKGSHLKIKADGTVSYNNPDCLKYTAPGSKPFKMPALKARADGSAKTFERIKADIEKTMLQNLKRNETPNPTKGRPAGGGYRMVITDFHRALVEPGEGTGERMPILDSFNTKAKLVASITNSEFHLALKRARVMAPPENHLVKLLGTPGQLEIQSSHLEPREQTRGNDAGDFAETLEVVNGLEWRAGFNLNYLEPMCGVWPLNVWYIDTEHAVVFEPAGAEWRYVVMPIRS